jgi:hypothetical protein
VIALPVVYLFGVVALLATVALLRRQKLAEDGEVASMDAQILALVAVVVVLWPLWAAIVVLAIAVEFFVAGLWSR